MGSATGRAGGHCPPPLNFKNSLVKFQITLSQTAFAPPNFYPWRTLCIYVYIYIYMICRIESLIIVECSTITIESDCM